MNLISELNINQINASLISIRNEIRNEIRKNSVFEKGTEFSVSPSVTNFIVGGLLTSDATEIKFSIVLPHTIESQSIIVTELKLNVRHSGSYIPNNSYVNGGTDFIQGNSVKAYKIKDNIVGICVKSNSAFNAENNYPLAIEINKITLQFK